ncbi:MAG: Gfo/Idh/MocA family oxidoreductase [Chloroflexota bacterium]
MKEILPPVEIALIGTGRMGSTYARIVDELARTRMVAVCGHGSVSAPAVGEALGVPSYTASRYDQMFADHPQIEAVIVATSEWTHLEPVLASIEAGKHVLVEKPMATSPDHAMQMMTQAEKAGVKLMVCHSLRFDRRYAAMQQAVSAGKIGETLHVYARRYSLQTAVDRVLGKFPLSYWIAPHDIDMMMWTVGSPVVSVKAYAKSGAKTRQDFFVAVLTFANGAIGVVESSWGTPNRAGRPQNILFTIRGTEGHMEVLGYENGVAFYGPHGEAEHPDTNYAPDVHGYVEGHFHALIRHFADYVRDLCPPLITLQDGLAVLRVSEAIAQSLEGGHEITLA